MRHLAKILLIAVLGYILSLFLPFWSVAIAGFLGSLIIKSGNLGAFSTGFIGIFLLWGATAILINAENNALLSEKIGQLFSMSPPIIILLTAIIGGITGGLGSLAGNQIRKTDT